MGKDSALYQLMGVRMHSVMNGIASSDGEYQAIIRKSDEYSGRLDGMELPKEIWLAEQGIQEKVDHHSYKRQGIEQIPSVHMGVSATQMERREIVNEKGDKNRLKKSRTGY